jgi:hypothetical protein
MNHLNHKYGLSARIFTGILLVFLLSCQKESKTPTPQAGGSVTGNAIQSAELKLDQFETRLVNTSSDSLIIFRFHYVRDKISTYGYIPTEQKSVSSKPATPGLPLIPKDVGYIDHDRDGYGIGSPKGMDSDDTNPAIHLPPYESAMGEWLNKRNLKATHMVYVTPNSTSDGDGSYSNPYSSVKRALRHNQQGLAVVLRSGSYTNEDKSLLNSLKGSQEAPLILMGYPGESVILIGQSEWVLKNSEHVVLINLTFKPGATEFNGLVFNESENIQVFDCAILESAKNGVVVRNSKGVVFKNTLIQNHSENGLKIEELEPEAQLGFSGLNLNNNGAAGVHITSSQGHIKIDESMIHSNKGEGLKTLALPELLALTSSLFFNNHLPINLESNNSDGGRSVKILNNTLWSTHRSQALKIGIGIDEATLFEIQKNILLNADSPLIEIRNSANLKSIRFSNNLLYSMSQSKAEILLLDQGKLLSASELDTQQPGFSDNVVADPKFSAREYGHISP